MSLASKTAAERIVEGAETAAQLGIADRVLRNALVDNVAAGLENAGRVAIDKHEFARTQRAAL